MNAVANVSQFKQALTHFEGQISSVSKQLSVSLPSHISVEKFQRTLMAAVKADPELLRADRASLINACEKAALDGLLPDKREAALVIFKRNYKDAQGGWQQALDVAYMPMAYGLRKKILQSGEVTDITAKVVYRREHEEGAFLYEEGTESMLRHRPLLDLTDDEAKDENIVAVYSMATYKDGTKSYEVMRRFEVDRVRECSQTGATKDRKGQPRKPSGPWVDFYSEMAKKTVMRRHSKTLPMSGDLMIDVEGREQDISARSTARMLDIKPDAPVSLPRGEYLDQEAVDPDTGEVTTDSRGMTEVDEETARKLDAGESDEEETEEEPQPEVPDATFHGTAKPQNAKRGDTWWDGERLRHAHDKGEHGIKWYLAPQRDDDPALQQAEAAAPATDEPAYLAGIRELRGRLADAHTLNGVEEIERDWNNVLFSTVDAADPGLSKSVDNDIAARKRDLREQQEG
jgi:recombination protein RecT